MFTRDTQKKYLNILNFQNAMSLILVGRLAEYRYYDMDDIILRALQVFEEMIR